MSNIGEKHLFRLIKGLRKFTGQLLVNQMVTNKKDWNWFSSVVIDLLFPVNRTAGNHIFNSHVTIQFTESGMDWYN